MKKVKVLENLIYPFEDPKHFVIAPTIIASEELLEIDSLKKYPKDGGWLGPINYEFALKEGWIIEIET